MHEIVKPVPILGLFKDDLTKKKKTLYKEKGWGDTSVEALLENLDFHLSKIDMHLKRDLFFTIAETKTGDVERELVRQEYIVFDIDKIDQSKKIEVAQAVCDFLGIPYEKTVTIFTGGGLHIGIKTTRPITSLEELQNLQTPFAHCCTKITEYLKSRGLAGYADPQMLSQGRMFRLPGTYNTKYGTDGILTELLVHSNEALDFDLNKFGAQDSDAKKAKIDKDYVQATPTNIDIVGVTEGCEFLNYTKQNASKLSEPEWFADLGVRVFLPKGRDMIHNIHSVYPGYSKPETDAKIDGILSKQTGPRRCKSIARTTGFDCSNCKYYQKVVTPLQIVSPDHISTIETGFRVPSNKAPMENWRVHYADLLKQFKREFTYFSDPTSTRVFIYQDNYWQPMDDELITGWAMQKIYPLSLNRDRREFLATVKDSYQRTPDHLRQTTNRKLNLMNGVYDADTDTLVPHSHDFGFMYRLPYGYDPKAKCPRFDKFLQEILPGDEGNQQAILEYIGYALFNDDCWLQQALFFTGEGSNGKSTLLRTIAALAGSENALTMNLSSIMEKDTKRAQLQHRLLFISEETKASAIVESEMFKVLVDGGTVDAKVIYLKDFTFENRAKLFLSFNSMSSSRDKTHALYRRMRKIPFEQRFQIDRALEPALRLELPGILNKVIEAYKRLHVQQKLTESEKSNQALELFKTANDTVVQFITENYEIVADEDTYVSTFDLYQEYCDWYRLSGFSLNNRRDVRYFKLAIKNYMGTAFLEKRKFITQYDRKTIICNLKKID